MSGLRDQSVNYGRMIRWAQFDKAAGYIRAQDGSSVSVDAASLAEIRVTSYKIEHSEFSPDRTEAIVDASIDYYDQRRNVINTIKDRQRWWYDEASKRWYLDGRLPDLK